VMAVRLGVDSLALWDHRRFNEKSR
jgi:hypothetical protein